MQLLVSVSSADEARAAFAGGADIIDAKDPHAGALGPVTLEAFAAIAAVVERRSMLTAALGDIEEGSGLRAPGSGTEVESLAYAYAAAGAALVKVGCTGDTRAASASLAAAVRGAGRAGAGVVAVAYADADPGAVVTLDTVIDFALAAGARGVLVDTANKTGPGLCGLIDPLRLGQWVARAHHAGLLAAVAGRLSAGDVDAVHASGADVVGVRGAACEGGRLGHVTARRVETLVAVLVARRRGTALAR